MKRKNKTKQRAGRLGGLATVNRHGIDHMRAIGKRGAQTTWNRYSLKPYGTSQHMMVERITQKIKKIIGRAPRMEDILQ